MPKPTVSICMITYNHEKFIVQAIESAASQKVDFDFEIIVGDDASSDATQQHLRELESRFPDIVKPVYRTTNIGMMPNFIDTYSRCRGEYVAVLEGDDYFCDPDKIRLQVEALIRQPNSSYSFHPVAYVDLYGTPIGIQNPPKDLRDFSLQKLISTNFVQTCSLMFPRKLLPTIPDWMKTLSVGDWPLTILLAAKGRPAFIHRTMSCYRKYDTSHWTGATELFRATKTRELIPHLKQILGPKYDLHLASQEQKIDQIIEREAKLRRIASDIQSSFSHYCSEGATSELAIQKATQEILIDQHEIRTALKNQQTLEDVYSSNSWKLIQFLRKLIPF